MCFFFFLHWTDVSFQRSADFMFPEPVLSNVEQTPGCCLGRTLWRSCPVPTLGQGLFLSVSADPAMRLSAQFSIVNLIDAQLSASVVCLWCMYSIVRALVDLPRFFSWVLSSGLTLQSFSECVGSVFFLLHHFLFFLPECGHDV